MMNTNLIEITVKMVTDYFETEGITESTVTIKTRAERWYNHTEITDAQTLAAVVMSGDFEPGITIKEIQQIEEFFYPSIPPEYTEIHIAEIEEAERDSFWW